MSWWLEFYVVAGFFYCKTANKLIFKSKKSPILSALELINSVIPLLKFRSFVNSATWMISVGEKRKNNAVLFGQINVLYTYNRMFFPLSMKFKRIQALKLQKIKTRLTYVYFKFVIYLLILNELIKTWWWMVTQAKIHFHEFNCTIDIITRFIH